MPNIKIKSFKNIKCKEYENSHLRFIIYHNTQAGRKNVYDVIIPTAWEPIVIGRELELSTVKNLIKEYENCFNSYFKGIFTYSIHDYERLIKVVKEQRKF